jgi:hypothetical protein
MNRPDFDRTGPDRTGQILKLAGPDRMEKIRPVPTLIPTINYIKIALSIK